MCVCVGICWCVYVCTCTCSCRCPCLQIHMNVYAHEGQRSTSCMFPNYPSSYFLRQGLSYFTCRPLIELDMLANELQRPTSLSSLQELELWMTTITTCIFDEGLGIQTQVLRIIWQLTEQASAQTINHHFKCIFTLLKLKKL